MDILPRVNYRFNTVSIKLPMTFFTEIDFFKVLKCIQRHRRPQIAKASLSRKGNAEVVTTPYAKLYYKAITTRQFPSLYSLTWILDNFMLKFLKYVCAPKKIINTIQVGAKVGRHSISGCLQVTMHKPCTRQPCIKTITP